MIVLRIALAFSILTFASLSSAIADGRIRGPARVIDAATIEVEGRMLRLYGIVAPVPGDRCPYRDTEIDCGHVAATALMDLTAATPVHCKILNADESLPAARCTAGGYDLSEGMVYTGWALPLPAAPERLTEVRHEAEENGHGLWRGAFPERVVSAVRN